MRTDSSDCRSMDHTENTRAPRVLRTERAYTNGDFDSNADINPRESAGTRANLTGQFGPKRTYLNFVKRFDGNCKTPIVGSIPTVASVLICGRA